MRNIKLNIPSFLKFQPDRKAFSLLTAIVVIVLMATVSFLVLNTSGKIIQETTSQYRDEQARLLAKSYTELAILAIMGHNRAVDCVNIINGTINALGIGQANPVVGGNTSNGGYIVNVAIQYIANGLPVSATCTQLNNGILGDTSGPNMLIDVYVRYQALDTQAGNPYFTTYHRRTLQKL